MIGGKQFRIKFDQVDGFIRVYDGTTYLVLFTSDKYDVVYNRIGYIIMLFLTITQESKLIYVILCF